MSKPSGIQTKPLIYWKHQYNKNYYWTMKDTTVSSIHRFSDNIWHHHTQLHMESTRRIQKSCHGNSRTVLRTHQIGSCLMDNQVIISTLQLESNYWKYWKELLKSHEVYMGALTTSLTNLQYADDICLLIQSHSDMQKMTK